MTDFYFDTSALLKRYVAENGSEWITSLVKDENNLIFTSAITTVEVAWALARREREKV